jgi:hypothetical protein
MLAFPMGPLLNRFTRDKLKGLSSRGAGICKVFSKLSLRRLNVPSLARFQGRFDESLSTAGPVLILCGVLSLTNIQAQEIPRGIKVSSQVRELWRNHTLSPADASIWQQLFAMPAALVTRVPADAVLAEESL